MAKWVKIAHAYGVQKNFKYNYYCSKCSQVAYNKLSKTCPHCKTEMED